MRIFLVRLKNLGKGVRIGRGSNISLGSEFEGNNFIGNNTYFYGKIGFSSYINEDCLINASIGRYSSIGSDVRILHASHPVTFVSTSPYFYSHNHSKISTKSSKKLFDEFIYKFVSEKIAVDIKNDVWIGSNVVLLGGVQIGNGAIVAAGSVVIGDVPDYAIVAGNPAKIIKYRFTEKQIATLLELNWWNWDDKKLDDLMDVVSSIEEFMLKFECH